MSWRWDTPADHEEIASKQEAKKYEREIDAILERASADDAIDFNDLADKVNHNVNARKPQPKSGPPDKKKDRDSATALGAKGKPPSRY